MSLRRMKLQYAGECHECTRCMDVDEQAVFDTDSSWIFHPECAPDPEDEPKAGKTGAFSGKTDGYRGPRRQS